MGRVRAYNCTISSLDSGITNLGIRFPKAKSFLTRITALKPFQSRNGFFNEAYMP